SKQGMWREPQQAVHRCTATQAIQSEWPGKRCAPRLRSWCSTKGSKAMFPQPRDHHERPQRIKPEAT
ncbi:MAG: hypothetical protein ACK6BG_07475, partial [Cyanobacteriota bacterium]